jgi:hypothetical protein
MSHQRFALVRRPAQRSSPPVGERGMLAAVLGAAALLLFGSLTLVAASLTFQSASSTGSDGEQAVDAAELGFNSIIEKLNTDPYRHLLVTKWANGNWDTGAGPARADCGISTAAPVGTADIRSGLQDVGSLQVSYTLTNFVPPQYPGAAPDPNSDPCPKFANRAGGTARLEVKGEVSRGGEVIATHTLVRDVTVEADVVSGLNNGVSSQPLGLLGTGGGSSTFISVEKDQSILSRIVRDNGPSLWQRDTTDSSQTIYCLGMTEALCRAGSSSLSNAFPVAEMPIGAFSQLYGSKPPVPVSPLITAFSAAGITGDISYPYSSGTALRSNCRQVQLAKPNGQSEQVIACRVSRIDLSSRRLTVNTDNFPVILYLMGDSKTGLLKLSGSAQIINTQFNASTRAANSTRWNRLRIYGDPRSTHQIQSKTVPSSCDNNSSKETWSIEGSSRITGAAIWAPTETIEFKEPSSLSLSEYSIYGTVWGCKLKYEKNVRHLVNGSAEVLSRGIDEMFNISAPQLRKYKTRGIERSCVLTGGALDCG